MPDPLNSPVAILGMHRSGTSCLAGSLQDCGLFLGDVNEDAPHNAKGNRENRIIMDFHEALLTSNGGSWDMPPTHVRLGDRDRERLSEIIASYPGNAAWGFKDPRTLLLLTEWLTALPDLRLVGTFRHPVAVARSLQARNGFSLERGIDLWLIYNELLLSFQERLVFDLVNYDMPEQDYQRRVSVIASRLNLESGDSAGRFFESSLRHSVPDSSYRLPDAVAAVHARLQERSQ